MKVLKLLAVFMIGFSIAGVSNVTQAAYNCRWVGAHWSGGQWYPAQKVCNQSRSYNRGYYQRNNHGNCRWMGAHWRYGRYVPAQRVCW